jgi:hypothetical protein
MNLPTKNRRPALAAGLLLTAVLAACGSETDSGDEPSTTPVETAGPAPRLVVAYPDRVDVVDATELSTEASFDVESSPYVIPSGDGRHVFTLEHEAGRTGVIDSGTWTDAHGDHGHSYTVDPAELDLSFEGTSYHAVSDDTRSVIWNDDEGSFAVLDHAQLEGDLARPRTIETGTPHHGVAVPTADGGFLATVSVDEDAVGVAVLDSAGKETARFEDCPGLHGETPVGETGYAFGCTDGIMIVDNGQARKIAAPVGGAGTGSLASDHESPILAGTLSAEDDPSLDTQVALYDTATGTARAVDVGAKYSNLVVDHGRAIVVGTDGDLRVVDLVSGEVTVVPAVEAWEKTEDWQEPRPYVAVAGDTVWVSEPATSSLHSIDLETGEVTATEKVDGEPGRLVVLNAPHEH